MEGGEAEEDEEDQTPSGLNMMEADAEFAIAQAKKMAEQRAILDSIHDETEVSANRKLIGQRPTPSSTSSTRR
ncbi:Cysteinyl-tRNA synthetase [Hordeum vulgare]|nr:Cysteinyl-tRNA synthetase [Hordeum vulgare]